jgi:O-succinylhomoserine sulfhydrylase
MSGGGGIVVLELDGGAPRAARFIDALQLLSHSGNLGDTRTIVTHPASSTHAKLTPEERDRVRVTSNMIRISVGLEHADDIIADIAQALERSAATRPAGRSA